MVYSSESFPRSAQSNKKCILALQNSLDQSISNFKELVLEFEQLQIASDDYKEQCERKVCIGSEALKKVIELKDDIIQSVASALTRLNETKDMSIIDEVFKILCGETATLTPPKDVDMQLKTPKKETSPSYTEPYNDESSEIDETRTGCKSPIITSRKGRKAAAPDYWPTPTRKSVKLAFPGFSTPQGKPGKGKLKQIKFTTVKPTSVVDVSNPEGSKVTDVRSMQLNIKRESLDDEDTIEPSPTSVTSNFSIYRSAIRSSPLKPNKDSPNKVKASPAKLSLIKKSVNKLKIKTEDTSKCNIENLEIKQEHSDLKMEESINLLRPLRFRKPEESPPKIKDPDETECNTDSSMLVLHHVNKLDKVSPDPKKLMCSPAKQPLAENINFTNLQTQYDTESSMSLLNNKPPIIKKDLELNPAVEGIVKKDLERLESKREEKVDVVFKEPTVRKKAEKMALPGWSCDDCRNFYAELHKDNPEMLAKKMQECSRHRGRQNPARPKTPPGFWQPRWDVPTDTEEFNRRNNAV